MNAAVQQDINSAFVALSKAYAGNLSDPYPTYARLRAQCPVYEGDLVAELGVPSLVAGREGGRKIFCLLGDEVVRQALLDPDTFSSDIYEEAFGGVMGDPVVLYLKGDAHRKYRSMLSAILSPAALRDLSASHFVPTIDGMVAALVDRGSAELMEDFILDFPIRVIYKLFGLPNDDPEAMQLFANRSLLMVLGGMIDMSKPEEAMERVANASRASQELFDQLVDTVRARRATGDFEGNDLISQLLRFDGDASLSNEDIAQMLRPNLAAAGETTSRAFANILACLLERPDVLEQVRQDRSLITAVINETMRFEGSVSIVPRITAKDVEICGVKIPAGSGVNVLVGAANRDPAVHNNPEEFSLEKRGKQGLSFGFGPHLCMGMGLARKEMEIALNAILDRLPNIRLDPTADYVGISGVQFRSPPTLPVIWDRP